MSNAHTLLVEPGLKQNELSSGKTSQSLYHAKEGRDQWEGKRVQHFLHFWQLNCDLLVGRNEKTLDARFPELQTVSPSVFGTVLIGSTWLDLFIYFMQLTCFMVLFESTRFNLRPLLSFVSTPGIHIQHY